MLKYHIPCELVSFGLTRVAGDDGTQGTDEVFRLCNLYTSSCITERTPQAVVPLNRLSLCVTWNTLTF